MPSNPFMPNRVIGRSLFTLACSALMFMALAPDRVKASEAFTVQAGPILDQGDAKTRCNNLAKRMGGTWNGQWWTTVEGEMSVCQIVLGGAKTAKTARSCDDFGTIKSTSSGKKIAITFINTTKEFRAIHWLDTNGIPKHYKDLQAGERYTQTTITSHPWMATDGPGNCIEIHMPKAGVKTIKLTKESPGFGPE